MTSSKSKTIKATDLLAANSQIAKSYDIEKNIEKTIKVPGTQDKFQQTMGSVAEQNAETR